MRVRNCQQQVEKINDGMGERTPGSKFTEGVAFIYEGQTERVFYQAIVEHYLSKHEGYRLIKEQDVMSKEYRIVISNNNETVVVKTFTVGTIIAHTRAAANWFRNNCRQRHKEIPWTTFLCYDTDSHTRDVSQFQEGDWKELRKAIQRNKRTSIIDLAASADIEDIIKHPWFLLIANTIILALFIQHKWFLFRFLFQCGKLLSFDLRNAFFRRR